MGAGIIAQTDMVCASGQYKGWMAGTPCAPTDFARQFMHTSPDEGSAPIQFIALPDADGQIDEQWLASLSLIATDPPVQRCPLQPRSVDFASLLASTEAVGRETAILFLRSGLCLPQHWRARLAGPISETNSLPRLPAGNYADATNPLAGFETTSKAEAVDGWCWLCAEHQASPVDHFPLDCLFLPAGFAGTDAADGPALLVDSLFVQDPARALHAGHCSQVEAAAALGPLRLRLLSLTAEENLPTPPPVGLDGKPVTLHISHDWGGGVARWIEDVATNDTQGHHLVLSASGDSGGTTHGQFLRLYAAGPGRGCVRELPLTPAIPDTVAADPRYRALTNTIAQRFAVGRVLISSLIGHSLDALCTGLPTAQILHDFYPAWPLLDRDPLDWMQADQGIDLEAALASHEDRLLFCHRQAAHWRALCRAWLAAVNEHSIRLIAPTQEVVRRWQALAGETLPAVDLIGHGFSGWPDEPKPVAGQARADRRLHLVVAGRLSSGKGLRLLDQNLDRLRPLAHITLLGCGRHGLQFFGRKGVDIVLDYQRDELPQRLRQLGPQAALFLSTVPETWNYTLSELRSLGIPPLATRLGSFIERIEDGHDGWLFDPQPDALVELIAKLHGAPELLAQAAGSQPEDPGMAPTLEKYWERIPAHDPQPLVLELAGPLHAAVGCQSQQVANARMELHKLQAREQALHTALEQRAQWARRYERLSEERTRWAQSLESEIKAERAVVKLRLDQLEDERQRLKHSLNETRDQLVVSQDHLDQTRQELQRRDQELQRRDQELQHSNQELVAARDTLQQVFTSRSWRWTRPLRLFNRVVDHGRRRQAWNPLRWPRLLRRLLHSLRFHGLAGTLQLAQGAPPPAPERSALPVVQPPAEQARHAPVQIPATDAPLASIVIPVYNKVAYTAACLESLRVQAGEVGFEVIVVDDCSTDETADFLARCEGLEVVRNTTNSGFIASCNAGAACARARFLVFLNNDTTVTEGWLDALIATFEDFPDAGVVGARLAYPDGRLQEAGGIIFDDASGWNYGRNEDPTQPQYNFTSEADYVSGACLAIPRQLFEELDGFDSHYAPAYYEDTDLCFRVRQSGRKVYCQPACTIIHHEGVSSGTDESSGTKRYQTVNREKFKTRWQRALATQPPHRIDSDRPDPVRRARFHRAKGRALFIDATTPMPDHDSGSMRFTAMLELMVERGWLVTFMPQNLKWDGRYSEALQHAGVEVLSAPAIGSLESWIKTNGRDLDLVLVSRHYVLEPVLKMLRTHCPGARVIFDTVDLHFLREQRQAELSGSASMHRAAERTRAIELKLMRSSDISLVVSPVEQALLADLAPDADVRVLSNIHQVHGRQHEWEHRRDLMFVGGFQHPPNVDAAEWLMDDIFPRIRAELPEVVLHLIGSRMPDGLREKASAGVRVHGFVEDLAPYLNGCRLSLAPLRYGAGVKGKVNQAMAWGLPVVATACAAEGMFLVDGEDILIAEDSAGFAAAVVRAYRDKALWQKLSDGGLVNVEQYFSRAAAARVIDSLLKETRIAPVKTA